MFPRLRKFLLTSTALVPLGLTPAAANPLGAQVVGGSATVQGQGTANVTVTQQSNSAIINWNTFNIGAGEKTKIVMPSASSVELDRVTGGLGPSQIYGSLWSNGRVFLVNPDGIMVGPGGKINTAGFLATTHDIANADFMAGRYNFSISGRPDASIVNQGMITAQNGGFAALVAPGVRNAGTITARLGTIALASGNAFTLDFYGDKLITLGVNDSIAGTVKDVATGQSLGSLVSNEGKLKANGGVVQLTAVAARKVVDSVINNKGVIEANSVGTHNGMIVLAAATGGSKPGGAPTQTVKVSGKLSAAGKRKGTSGGTVEVTGESVQLTGAKISASGQAGGGTVLIGGDTGGGNPNPAATAIPQAALQSYTVPTATTTSVDAATTIDASAKLAGNGGKVIVWSNLATTFNGTVSTHGGAQGGNGGFVEASGHQLSFNGSVSTSAPNGSNGTLLLDPLNATIAAAAGSEVITTSSIENALSSGDVDVTTAGTTGSEAGDIIVASDLAWTTANTLALSAYRNITINDGVTVANAGAGNLVLRADATGNGVGTVNFNGTGKVNFSASTGVVSILYNPTWFSVPQFCEAPCSGGGVPHVVPIAKNYASSVLTNSAIPQQLTAYMLVNDVTHLQYMSNALNGTYALGRDIDASATAGWNGGAGFIPIGNGNPFTGTLVGVGEGGPFLTGGAVITNLTIKSTGDSVGLFGYIGPGGLVSNVSLDNANITSLVGNNLVAVGGIAASNAGTIIGASISGFVTGNFDSDIGGLVGFNNGYIGGSYSTVAVSGSSPLSLGGLVGRNFQGVIDQSFSAGPVIYSGNPLSMNGTTFGAIGPVVGGLSGYNGGSIIQSYSTSPISYGGGQFFWSFGAPATATVGGLVGLNFVGGTVSQSYASGSVGGSSGTVTGGLIGYNSAGFFVNTGIQAPNNTGVNNSYWDVLATGQSTSAGSNQSTSAGGSPSPPAQLKGSLPSGFDPTVWGSTDPTINNGYPYLLWQTASAPVPPTTLSPTTPSTPQSPPTAPPTSTTETSPPPSTNLFSDQQTTQLFKPNWQIAGPTTPSVITNINSYTATLKSNNGSNGGTPLINAGSNDAVTSTGSIGSIVIPPQQSTDLFDKFSQNQDFQKGYDQVAQAAAQTAFVAGGAAVGASIGAIIGFVGGGAAGSVVPVAGTAAGATGGAIAGADAGAIVGATVASALVGLNSALNDIKTINAGQPVQGTADAAGGAIKTTAGLVTGIPLLSQLTLLVQGVGNISEGAIQTYYGP